MYTYCKKYDNEGKCIRYMDDNYTWQITITNLQKKFTPKYQIYKKTEANNKISYIDITITVYIYNLFIYSFIRVLN